MRDYINLNSLDDCILVDNMSVRIYDDHRPAKIITSEDVVQFLWRKTTPNSLPEMGIVHMGWMSHAHGTHVWVESSQLLMVLK